MTISTILFDLDGTLLDTAPDMANALNKMRARHRMDPLPLKDIRPHVGYGSRALLELGFNLHETDEHYPAYLEEFFNEYEACMNQSTNLFEGMDDALKQLENANLNWGVITNKPKRFTDGILHQLELQQRACIVICGDTLPRRKPHPDQLHHACNTLNVTTKECIYVGDTITDITASKAAEMKVIAALYGYIGENENPLAWDADDFINGPHELIGALGRLGAPL